MLQCEYHFTDQRYEAFIAKKPYLQSQFLIKKEERKQEEEMQKLMSSVSLKVEEKQEEKDPYEEIRMHCWVLILPGKRVGEVREFRIYP